MNQLSTTNPYGKKGGACTKKKWLASSMCALAIAAMLVLGQQELMFQKETAALKKENKLLRHNVATIKDELMKKENALKAPAIKKSNEELETASQQQLVEAALKVDLGATTMNDNIQESSGATNGDTLETPPKQTALKPPFRIVQFGQPRSGSTFQTHLLDAIISMKSPSSTHIIREFIHNKNMARTRKLLDHESYIGKTHNCGGKESGRIIKDAAKKGEVPVFKSIFSANSSSQINSFPYAVYTQESNNLLSCSLCEVDNYKNVFNLSDEEVQHVKDYMSKYEIIRRCCGMQMSKYEVKRLNGCNMQKYRQLPEYPNCEQHNKTDIELQYVNNPGGIENHIFYHKFVWSKLGDCQRFDEIIASGRGFNNRKFDGSQC